MGVDPGTGAKHIMAPCCRESDCVAKSVGMIDGGAKVRPWATRVGDAACLAAAEEGEAVSGAIWSG
jgi:hypothetical protein